jgi:hypothetical protein
MIILEGKVHRNAGYKVLTIKLSEKINSELPENHRKKTTGKHDVLQN